MNDEDIQDEVPLAGGRITPGVVRVGIGAPPDVPIVRGELLPAAESGRTVPSPCLA